MLLKFLVPSGYVGLRHGDGFRKMALIVTLFATDIHDGYFTPRI